MIQPYLIAKLSYRSPNNYGIPAADEISPDVNLSRPVYLLMYIRKLKTIFYKHLDNHHVITLLFKDNCENKEVFKLISIIPFVVLCCPCA